MSTRGRPRPRAVRRIAIIDWSHLIEDYLDGIGADLHDLRDELTGGWLFGMVDALGSVDVRTTLVTISGQVPERLRWRHRPTGATISLLPAPAAYRRIRRMLWNPYAWSVEDAATVPHPAARLPLAGLLALAPYLATPVRALARELRLRADAKVVVWHGRVLVDVKGLDVLLRAWRTIRRARTGRSFRLLLIGDGPDAERLASMLRAVDDPTIIWRRGFVTDRARLVRWVGTGDVPVLSSRREGFPVAPVEAMAAGVPVVLTDVSGARDILPRSELDGGLVVPVDDHAALADALDHLLADDASAARVGVAAARRAREAFSLEAVGRRLRDALNRSQRAHA
ncbi:MAG: glycosyltransferase family 4 protein [Actinobacteria bacterium]|nr:glycosyltransferase family 4 protein [Actinomycetota bacterium]